LFLGSPDSSPSKLKEIAKVVLWYLPIVVEIAAHFIANTLPGHVRYSSEHIVARSGTLFVIILGGGLDKITRGFQQIVGNTQLGSGDYRLFLSTAVIFIVMFLLYFGSTGGSRELGSQRALAWFFVHIFYLSALIITLQGMFLVLHFTQPLTLLLCTGIATSLSFTVRKSLAYQTPHPH
jgi:low temperature requirement protein LtrA